MRESLSLPPTENTPCSRKPNQSGRSTGTPCVRMRRQGHARCPNEDSCARIHQINRVQQHAKGPGVARLFGQLQEKKWGTRSSTPLVRKAPGPSKAYGTSSDGRAHPSRRLNFLRRVRVSRARDASCLSPTRGWGQQGPGTRARDAQQREPRLSAPKRYRDERRISERRGRGSMHAPTRTHTESAMQGRAARRHI